MLIPHMGIRTWFTEISDALTLAGAADQSPPTAPPRRWALAMALPGGDLDRVLLHTVVAAVRLGAGVEVLADPALGTDVLMRPLARYPGWPPRIVTLAGDPAGALRTRLAGQPPLRLVVADHATAASLGVREGWLPPWWPDGVALNVVRNKAVQRPHLHARVVSGTAS
jgi:hypothetical protein